MPFAAPVITAVLPARRMRSATSHRLRRSLELHRAVLYTPISHHRKILYVILMQTPGRLRSLTRQRVERAQNISRVKVDHGFLDDVRIVDARGADGKAVMVHVIQESANILGDEVTLQSPRCICIADCEGEIGDVAEHHAFVDQRLRHLYWCPVYYQLRCRRRW